MSPLPELRDRLLALHKLLLDDETRAWQAAHGRAVSGQELFRLLLEDEQFAWLRALSRLVSEIDAALDEAEGAPAAALDRRYLGQARGLLRSEREDAFATRYREALQRSPDVVMAHAALMRLTAPPARA